MSNPSKKKGTAAETRVVKYLKSFGIEAKRKALSGSKDQGDIEVPDFNLVIEVKAGEQTKNPTRMQLNDWMNQALAEGANSGCRAVLIVARHGKNPADYDVWRSDGSCQWTHWYLNDWCMIHQP